MLDLSKLKALADNKETVIKGLKYVVGRVEDISGKEENAGLPAFSPFPTTFSKPPFSGSLNVRIVCKDY